jgi:hypothetical protein
MRDAPTSLILFRRARSRGRFGSTKVAVTFFYPGDEDMRRKHDEVWKSVISSIEPRTIDGNSTRFINHARRRAAFPVSLCRSSHLLGWRLNAGRALA